MQFSTIATIAALFTAAQAATSVVVVSDVAATVTDTVTSCGPEVTNCPGASHTVPHNGSNVTISTFEGAGVVASGSYAAMGAAALVGAAILGL